MANPTQVQGNPGEQPQGQIRIYVTMGSKGGTIRIMRGKEIVHKAKFSVKEKQRYVELLFSMFKPTKEWETTVRFFSNFARMWGTDKVKHYVFVLNNDDVQRWLDAMPTRSRNYIIEKLNKEVREP